MKILQMILFLSIASILFVGPIGFARAVDAHHPNRSSGSAKAKPIKKTKMSTKNQAAQSEPMPMGSMMMNCSKMHRGQTGHGKMMQCPMAMGNSVVAPFHLMRMQWHHNMMMWHHNMIHGPSSKHQGS